MRVGSVGYCTAQGLGHLARDFYTAGVVTDPILFHHSQRLNHREWYSPDTPYVATRTITGPEIDAVLGRVQAMLFWETPFDWSLLTRCRERGVKTILCPMYEWSPRRPPALPDLLACPSKLDVEIFAAADAWKCIPSDFLPIPVRTDLWQQRTTACRFLHNAGNVGHREHKGTRELLRAIPHITTPLSLTIRAQDGAALQKVLDSVSLPERSGGRASVRFEVGERPYESLWEDYDVLVAPEKLNGLSLPLQEARAAGMLVMTSDRFPHNDWLPREPLIPVAGYHKACVTPNYLEFDEAEVRPEHVARTMDNWYGRDIAEYSQGGREWAESHSWSELKPKWLGGIASCL